MTTLSRRELLKHAGIAGAGALVGARGADAQDGAITIAGQRVEIAIAAASPLTTRITIAPIVNGAAQTVRGDGSLVERAWPAPVARLRTIARPTTARVGDLRVRVAPAARALQLSVTHADGRAVQQLGLDQGTGALTFSPGDGPILGLG